MSDTSQDLSGATLIARSLKQQGCDYMFGVVGFPVIPIASAAQTEGIHYFGFRNEQSASYAAGAVATAVVLRWRQSVGLAVVAGIVAFGLAGPATRWLLS